MLVALFAGTTAHLFVWPDLPPVPPRVDAIILLGGPGDRDEAAAALARAHAAPVLVQSIWDPGARPDRCLHDLPGVTVVCFHPRPDTTQGEAEYLGQLARQRDWHSVILVATTDQAWRARLRFTRCFGGDVYVSTAPLPPLLWFRQIPYQWAATVKALVFERAC